MPNDAKLGLVVGVVLVLSAAVLFFPAGPAAAPAPEASTQAVEPSKTPSTPASLPPPALTRPETKGRTASRVQE